MGLPSSTDCRDKIPIVSGISTPNIVRGRVVNGKHVTIVVL